jgi:hypothetical protein
MDKKWWHNRKKSVHRIRTNIQTERRELAKHGHTIAQLNDAEELLGLVEEIVFQAYHHQQEAQ